VKSVVTRKKSFFREQSRCCPLSCSPPAAPGERPLSPGAAHSVLARGRTRVGFPDPEVPLPAPFLCLGSYLSAVQPQSPLPASKRITFPLDLNFLVLTVQEKRVLSVQPNPFKHSLPPPTSPPQKSARVKS
jgi:hypothetical protein